MDDYQQQNSFDIKPQAQMPEKRGWLQAHKKAVVIGGVALVAAGVATWYFAKPTEPKTPLEVLERLEETSEPVKTTVEERSEALQQLKGSSEVTPTTDEKKRTEELDNLGTL